MPIPWDLPIDEITDLLYAAIKREADESHDPNAVMAEALRQVADDIEGYPLEATFARWDLERVLPLLAMHPNELIASQLTHAAKKRYAHLSRQDSPSDAAGSPETRISPPPVPKAPKTH